MKFIATYLLMCSAALADLRTCRDAMRKNDYATAFKECAPLAKAGIAFGPEDAEFPALGVYQRDNLTSQKTESLMKSFTKLAAWKKFLDGREFLSDNPFEKEALGDSPVFLYSSVTSPLPAASMGASWTAYSCPQKLAAHLRFGLLLGEFSIWLCREEWDKDASKVVSLESLFEGARAANSAYCADIPLMEKLAAQLDQAMIAHDDAQAFSLIQSTCRKFNRRWGKTSTWDFEHRPLKNLKQLSQDVLKRENCALDHDEFKEVAAGALINAKKQREFKNMLEEATVI